MRFAPLTLLFVVSSLPSFAADANVSLKPTKTGIDVSIGGEPFTEFIHGGDWAKPYFSPVRGPGGTILTRPIGGEGSKDHPHHKGIWLAVDEVDGIKFWAEKGKIATISVTPTVSEGNPAQLDVVNHWLGEDGQPVLEEKTRISLFADRLVTYDITFTAVGGRRTFEDTKEGLFAFRMVDSMREKEGGHVINAEGDEGTKACWGRPSKWIDYYGMVDGKTFGVTLMDHPDNFRPSRYHVRDYGLFSISPFGEKAYSGGKSEANELEVEAGKSVRLRYGLYIHAGDTKTGKVADAYQQFLKATATK